MHIFLMEEGALGKTSAAKILARAVNCLNPHDGEPCNECEICKAMLSGSLTDVVEMDAASNNSVEDIRGIREEVNFLPTRAKYRVYIIDEVHMLSTGAFNALLKTLEEPPEHVKFILATTEPQKLPATILSRCQRFDFKRISTDDVVKRLKIICHESNIEITEDALKMIAVLSEGAMRDAISILERCTGEQIGLIDENQVRDLVGIPKIIQIYGVVKSIIELDSDQVILATNSIINEGKDVDNFLWEIIKYIKDVLVYKSSKSLDLYNNEEKVKIEELASKVAKEKLLQLIYTLSELANNIKWSSQKTVMFQAGLINACMEAVETKSQHIDVEAASSCPQENKIKDAAVSYGKNINNTINENQNTVVATSSGPQKENIIQKKPSAGGTNLSYWDNVITKIKQSGKMGIYVNLIGSKAKEINDMTIEVELANKNSFAKNILETHENKAEIERIASIEAGKTMNVRFISQDDKKTNNVNANSLENMVNGLDIPINIIDE